MTYQIDQSGKIEQTHLDTIIALSNDKQYVILLPKKTKRLLQEMFRNQRKPRRFVYDTKSIQTVFIDREYQSNEATAHLLAAKVGIKKIKPDQVIKLEDITEILWPLKKIGYSAINGTEGNLTQDWIPGGRKPSRSVSKRYHKKRKKSRIKRGKHE